ncbi:S41 family peptidase [candidate division CSSED10-310 bacterium]|uniref:S41 family peptidase n=1 Tax=candidate division CSSED10-310 bacterium TaxID=2855610 RepID=A0ABV6Z4H7_UNCC1
MNISKSCTLFTVSVAVLFFIGVDHRVTGTENSFVLDKKTKTAVISSINSLLLEKYIFLDIAEKMKDRLSTKLSKGDYNSVEDPAQFAQMLHSDLYEISQDNHFYIQFNPERARLIEALKSKSKVQIEEARRRLMEEDRFLNFGFKKLEHLTGDVGYLDLRSFCNPEYAGGTAVAAMNFLSHSDAIIIDLRKNSGGWPPMVQLLCSYFIAGTQEGRTLLNSFERRFDNSLEQFWTLAYVPGKRMFDVDLFILTSKNTGSGAEEFTYNMKNLKRATIIGETTHGSAHPVESVVIQDFFVMNLPTGRPINPISKTNWEKTGVEPDIAVPADQALDKAYLIALEKLLPNTKDKRQKFRLTWAMDGLQAKLDPLKLSLKVLQKFVGDYGERKVWLEKNHLMYQRTGPQFKMIPLKENLFALEDLDYFRIKFSLDEQGRITELIGLYDNGMSDVSKRIK